MAFNKAKALDAARKLVEKGQTDRAIKEYLKIVEHDPKDVRVWLKIGDLQAKRGAKQEATDTYLKVAKFYGEQGFYLKAVAVYKQILKLDARLVEVNLKLAELYRQLGLLSDAMQHFERVAAHFHREGKTQEALATIRQLVDLDPDNVATRIKLAELYSKEQMTEEAITEFRHACAYLRTHNRQDDFLKVAERLLWHDASDIGLNRELATLYLRRNDARRALQKLQVCFKADSRDVETLALLAQAFQALDQKAKTVSVLKELARVFTENGQTAQAGDVHRKILMLAPDDPDSRAALGEPPSTRLPAAAIPAVAALVPDDARGARRAMGNPTGSMPLVVPPDEDLEMEVEGYTDDEPEAASPPEPEEDSFVADMASDEESFSVPGPAVEANADEIVKILTETDVYVKYGLQQKAIDHLQRVFELDPGNVEARERLKDIYLADGRESEVVAELVTLAELVAAQDPDRAEGYLTEAAALAPDDEGVLRMARRLQVALGEGPEVEIVDDLSAPIELSADELGSGNVAPVESDLEFDELDFDAVGDVEVGYDIPAATVEEPEPEPMSGKERSQITQEVDFEQLEDELSLDEAPVDELSFDQPEGTAELSVEDVEFEPSDVRAPEPAIASGFDDAESLDAAPMDLGATALPGERVPPARVATPTDAPEHLDPDDDLGIGFAGREPTHTQPNATAEEAPSTSLEDDLDEADFFVTQGLFDEARDILATLLEKYQNHPLILAKLQDVEAMAAGAPPEAPPLEPDDLDAEPLPDDRIADELAQADLGESPEARARVKLEHAIADEDADTHFDLGLAYKEMGLHDEAIKAFEKVLHVAARAVEANLMIGLCYREQGALAEAVQQFKNGLYVDTITDTDKLSLYFEIGVTYEQMDDPGEASYFYEMVSKKEAGYRDVRQRLERLAGAGGGNGSRKRKKKARVADEVESAFENVLESTDEVSGH